MANGKALNSAQMFLFTLTTPVPTVSATGKVFPSLMFLSHEGQGMRSSSKPLPTRFT